MAGPRNLSIRTPGVALAMGDAAAIIESESESEADPIEPVPAAETGHLPPDLAAIVAAEVAKALRAQAHAARPLTEAELPDQSEIDPGKITRPMLSKQGYVVPNGYGMPAAEAARAVR